MRTVEPTRARTLVERKAWKLLEENRILVRKLSYLCDIDKRVAYSTRPHELLGEVITWLFGADEQGVVAAKGLLLEYLSVEKANDFLELCTNATAEHGTPTVFPLVTEDDLDYRFWGI
jgi:hypothetical protein